jgi:6-pyruvoyltetrahydropterin/6-carboxytetrahydropterin synthase
MFYSILKANNPIFVFMIYLTRRERFSAAHRLCNPKLSDEENSELYGPCANPHWHGHNYILWVTVKGKNNPKTGYVVDLKQLSGLIQDKIVKKLDHRNLNLEVDFLNEKIASTENLVIGIWEQLEPSIRNLGVELHAIKIQETENNIVEYFGN